MYIYEYVYIHQPSKIFFQNIYAEKVWPYCAGIFGRHGLICHAVKALAFAHDLSRHCWSHSHRKETVSLDFVNRHVSFRARAGLLVV